MRSRTRIRGPISRRRSISAEAGQKRRWQGGVSGVPLSREENMLARGTPEAPLDVRRLSDFSAEPKKSHGAGSAHRIQHRERPQSTLSRSSSPCDADVQRPRSETGPTRGHDCNRSAMGWFAAARCLPGLLTERLILPESEGTLSGDVRGGGREWAPGPAAERRADIAMGSGVIDLPAEARFAARPMPGREAAMKSRLTPRDRDP